LEAKEPQVPPSAAVFFSMRFEYQGHKKMRSELHRNQVTDAQTVHENLRDAAYHEPGTSSLPAFWDSQLEKLKLEKTEVVAPTLVLASTYR
jgi:hypothetical protein